MIRVLWVLFLTLSISMLSSCRACDGTETIATLESKHGEVQRSLVASASNWNEASVGADFTLGDGVRTAHAAEAMLGLAGGGRLEVRQDTVIRFLNRRPSNKHRAFNVETGEALLEAGEQELLLIMDKGQARLGANGKLTIQNTDRGIRFELTVGKAQIETEDGLHQLEAGQSYLVNVGNAAIEPRERSDAGRAAPSQPASSASPEPPIGEGGVAARVSGSGVSQRVGGARDFSRLLPGETRIRPGTLIRVDAGSSVELVQGRARVSLAGAGTYNVKADSSGFVELESGGVAVSGASRIVVPGGTIETADNSSATMKTTGKYRTHIGVAQGTASLIGARGTTNLSAGEEATLNADGSTVLEGHGLGYADIVANAGDTFVVHDPKPPTAIRLLFGSRCPKGGSIVLKSRKNGRFASGETAAALAFGPGRNDYALHCLSEGGKEPTPVARGTITVLNDAGTRPVPKTPPSTSVQVDGHNYTILYQNQLPRLTVVWPNAPADASYALFVESPGGSKRYTTSTPTFSFKSGALSEGRHTVYFEAGGRVSRHTRIAIQFDNAAPMASLSTPVQQEVREGETTTISGTVLAGWEVEVGGSKVVPDGQQRFSQQVAVPTAERALSVKLTHPARGVHVYVRRLARRHD